MAAKPELASIQMEYQEHGVITESIFNKINELLNGFRNLPHIAGFDESTIIIDDKAGTVEEIYNDYGRGDFDDGDWFTPEDRHVPDVLEFLSPSSVQVIREHMVQDYIYREKDTQVDPEIIDEIKGASVDELFEMLREYDDPLYDAMMDSMKKTYSDALRHEQENYVEQQMEYNFDSDEPSPSFERTGEDADGNTTYRMVVEASDFIERVVPKLERGDNDHAYHGGNWGSLLNLYLPEAADDIEPYDEEWMPEYSAKNFEQHETFMKIVGNKVRRERASKQRGQQGFDF